MDYLSWNSVIAARFFNAQMKNQRVYLYVTQELINQLATGPCGVDDFVQAVKTGPPFANDEGICAKAERCFVNWRKRGEPYPPYVAYLAFFVLAAGLKGKFAPQAYYPRLRTLLGEPPSTGTYQGFATMRTLWEDLENWSQKDRHSELGVLEVHLTTRLIHVGIPISQIILAEAERQELPRIFAEAGLDPSSAPGDALLAQLLSRHGASRLRAHTIRILEQGRDTDEFEVLIDAVLRELEQWNGNVEEKEHAGREPSVFGSLHLWCESLDEVSETATVRLLCRTRHEYPEDSLIFKLPDVGGTIQCSEFRSGWSTPLANQFGAEVDASILDWSTGVRIRDMKRGWNFSLDASPARVFVTADEQGLSGIIEIRRLPSSGPFFVALRQDCAPAVEGWARSSCVGFRLVPIEEGLPADWSLYAADRAIDDSGIRELFPSLSFSQTTQINLRGGIRETGNTFFGFALPTVSVTGAKGDSDVYCNDQRLGEIDAGEFSLKPYAESASQKITIEVRDGMRTICRRALYITTDAVWPQLEAKIWSDELGKEADIEQSRGVAGSQVVGTVVPEFKAWILSNVVGALPVSPIVTVERREVSKISVDPPKRVNEKRIESASESDLKGLLNEWRTEVRGGIATEYYATLNTLPMGRQLTEGSLHYISAVFSNESRSWSRAIKELSTAADSENPIVRIAATALLQLAFYRSDRLIKCEELRGVKLPHQFRRLEQFMNRLAGANADRLDRTGLGIGDISPVEDDNKLEGHLFLNSPA